jgi:hypothetical protein
MQTRPAYGRGERLPRLVEHMLKEKGSAKRRVFFIRIDGRVVEDEKLASISYLLQCFAGVLKPLRRCSL